MHRGNRIFQIGLLLLAAGMLSFAPAICQASPPAASGNANVKKAQEVLRSKGFYSGKTDGLEGPQTHAAIRKYQKAEGLPVTGRLDAKTAGKLGVGQESVGGSFANAGRQAGRGSKAAASEITKGKPVAAGKEFGKGMGRFGKNVGKGVKKAVKP